MIVSNSLKPGRLRHCAAASEADRPQAFTGAATRPLKRGVATCGMAMGWERGVPTSVMPQGVEHASPRDSMPTVTAECRPL